MLFPISNICPRGWRLATTKWLVTVYWLVFHLLTWNANVHSVELAWPQKTGPYACGVAAEEHARDVPLHWNEESGTNIAWQVKLEGSGHSTPVIGDGRIWFTAANEDGTKQFVYCIDAESGKTLHHKLLFENVEPEPLGNTVNSYASPTCVLNEDAIYVHFGTYGTARLAPLTAETVWQRRDIHCRHFRGPGSSPAIYKNLLFLTFDGIDQQFLTALNTETGKTVWRTERTTDYGDLDEQGKPLRDGDLRKAYSTPVVIPVEGRPQAISVGSRAAFSYDAQTGKELWTITHDDYNAAAQPIAYGNTVILNTGSRGANLMAVQLNESTRGDVTKSHVVWNREKGNSRLSFPVLYESHVYSVTGNGVITCVNAESGEERWSGRIGGNFVASPVVVNGHIYVFDDAGRGTVIDTGDEFRIVARNELSEGTKASPAVAYGSLYLRTASQLYKISKVK